jgi:hypothetical protein
MAPCSLGIRHDRWWHVLRLCIHASLGMRCPNERHLPGTMCNVAHRFLATLVLFSIQIAMGASPLPPLPPPRHSTNFGVRLLRGLPLCLTFPPISLVQTITLPMQTTSALGMVVADTSDGEQRATRSLTVMQVKVRRHPI